MRRKCEGFSVDVTLLVLSMLQNKFIIRSYPKAMVRNYTVEIRKPIILNQSVFIFMFHCDVNHSNLLQG